MNRILRFLFYNGLVKLVVTLVLGLNVRHRERLPNAGPAIVVANHNSHLDTMVLVSLLPKHLLPDVQPVAAMDYFFRNRFLRWFALHIVGILPLKRKQEHLKDDLLKPCYEALERGRVLIFFPEGSRGEPERMSKMRGGIAKLAERFPEVPVVPVLLHGLGKALPKGEALLVPFFCDVFVGEALHWTGDRKAYLQALTQRMEALAQEGHFAEWR